MKENIVKLLLGLVVVLFGHCANGQEAGAMQITAYFLPFEIETYSPVTKETIESNVLCSFSFVANAAEGAQLRSWLMDLEPGGLDNRVVRLKLVGLDESPVFVDRDRGVQWGSRRGKLKETAFQALGSYAEETALRHDCDPRIPSSLSDEDADALRRRLRDSGLRK